MAILCHVVFVILHSSCIQMFYLCSLFDDNLNITFQNCFKIGKMLKLQTLFNILMKKYTFLVSQICLHQMTICRLMLIRVPNTYTFKIFVSINRSVSSGWGAQATMKSIAVFCTIFGAVGSVRQYRSTDEISKCISWSRSGSWHKYGIKQCSTSTRNMLQVSENYNLENIQVQPITCKESVRNKFTSNVPHSSAAIWYVITLRFIDLYLAKLLSILISSSFSSMGINFSFNRFAMTSIPPHSSAWTQASSDCSNRPARLWAAAFLSSMTFSG